MFSGGVGGHPWDLIYSWQKKVIKMVLDKIAFIWKHSAAVLISFLNIKIICCHFSGLLKACHPVSCIFTVITFICWHLKTNPLVNNSVWCIFIVFNCYSLWFCFNFLIFITENSLHRGGERTETVTDGPRRRNEKQRLSIYCTILWCAVQRGKSTCVSFNTHPPQLLHSLLHTPGHAQPFHCFFSSA